MRIIAGKKRGLVLMSPKSDVSRPILDRVKESLFSVLYKYNLIEGRAVADLFSGVGSLCLEALSRGASRAVFVEKDAKVLAVLRKNIEKAGFVEESRIIRANAFKVGAPVDFDGGKYSIIFVDPPYPTTKNVGEGSALAGLLVLLADQLADDGIAVVRTHKSIELLERYDRLEIIERRVWGNMAVAFLRKKKDDEQAGGNTDN